MLFVALDQSSKVSGYCVFDDDRLIDYGHISSPANHPIEKRLLKLIDLLDELLQKYHFDRLVFEDIQEQNGNVKTFKVLAQVQGAILLWCVNNKMDYEIVPPMVWRKNVKDTYGVAFGKLRAEQKKASMDFVKEHYHIEATEDESDAICIGTSLISKKVSAW